MATISTQSKFFSRVNNNLDALSGAAPKGSGYENARLELENWLKSLQSTSEVEKIQRPSLPELPEYERMKVDDMTADDMFKLASDKLNLYKQAGEKAIDAEIDSTETTLGSAKSAQEKSRDEREMLTNSAYEEYKKNLENDSLKRGLARSSIALNKIDAVENERTATLNNINQSYVTAITDIDNQLASLEQKRDKALNDFNITYVAKLTEEINSLKTDRVKKKDDALKYNNTLTEKETEYQKDKKIQEDKLYTERLEQKELEDKLKAAEEKAFREKVDKETYNKCRDLLAGLSPGEAQQRLKNDTFFRNNLSQYYYFMLYDEFKG